MPRCHVILQHDPMSLQLMPFFGGLHGSRSVALVPMALLHYTNGVTSCTRLRVFILCHVQPWVWPRSCVSNG